ncbi:phosphoadenosine phosphosulfate reductase family protein [Granulicella sp. L60]|uniref:phosphoadenosine phosphosulfate reductase domain-containing protein n=1 Tax=Granulicella sp. L60 TaxID=1641866 RepID=UPI00131A6E09|nr:phosphoadenosine phosphosulfate reductase family protein [Granulicella sp. L60]
MKRLFERFDGSVALVINHSGGKDSTRMLGFVRERLPEATTLAVMADTGFEHQRPISATDFARDRCAEFGVPLTVVRNSRRNYLEMVEQRGMFPSAQYRQCTSDLKRGPIEKYIRTLPYRLIFNCMGIRSEESPPRAKLHPLSLNSSLTTQTRIVYNWFPIFEESLADVLTWHWDHCIPLHPVYVPKFHKDGTTGGYLRRLSCRLCIFSTDSDLLAIRQHDPEAFLSVSALEQKIGFTMRSTGSLIQIVDEANSVIEAQSTQVCLPF